MQIEPELSNKTPAGSLKFFGRAGRKCPFCNKSTILFLATDNDGTKFAKCLICHKIFEITITDYTGVTNA